MPNHAKPVEQKRRLGNPGQRRLPRPGELLPLDAAHVQPPAVLDQAGRRLWSEVLAVAPWVSRSDQIALGVLCDLADRREAMLAEVEAQGQTLSTPNGAYQAHPLLAHIRDATKQLLAGLSLFGLTPSDRTRIGAGEVQAKTKLQQLIEAERRG